MSFSEGIEKEGYGFVLYNDFGLNPSFLARVRENEPDDLIIINN